MAPRKPPKHRVQPTPPSGSGALSAKPRRRSARLDPELVAIQKTLERSLARRTTPEGQADPQTASEIARLRRLIEIFREEAADVGDGRPPDGDADNRGFLDEDSEDAWRAESMSDEFEGLGETDEEGRWWPRKDWRDFGPTHPIPVHGGLVARSRRGEIGETWWSKRFLSAIERIAAGDRLNRGRSYARKGQVIDLVVGPGTIRAHVQGSRTPPYEVQVAIPVFDEVEWATVFEQMVEQAGYAARLLAGEMPHEIEQVFERAGVDLLPATSRDLTTQCDCPDWENPCKHIAAVCYLVAEAFDADPFLLFALRGCEREPLLGELRRLRREGDIAAVSVVRPVVSGWVLPLVDVLGEFWRAGPELDEVRVLPREVEDPAAALIQVRRGLVNVQGRDLADLFGEAYENITHAAAQRAF